MMLNIDYRLVMTALFVILGLSAVIGSLASVIAVVILLFLSVRLSMPRLAVAMKTDVSMAAFVTVFLVLAAAFAATAAQAADVLFAVNFLALLVSPVVWIVLRPNAGSRLALLLLALCLAGSILAAGMAGIDVKLRGLARAEGFFGGPNLMPRIAIPLGFVALGGVFVARGAWRLVFYLGPLAALVVTYLSGSRGAAVAVPPLLLLCVVALAAARDTRRDVVVLLGVAIVIVTGLVSLAGDQLLGRFSSVSSLTLEVLAEGRSSDRSTELRLEMYRTGARAFLQSPWIGHGWAHLGTTAAQTNPDVFAKEAGTRFMFHNDLVNFAVAAGAAGVACLFLLLAAPLVSALRGTRDSLFRLRLYCCLVLVVAYVFFGVTDSTFGYDLPTTLYVVLTAAILGGMQSVRIKVQERAAAP